MFHQPVANDGLSNAVCNELRKPVGAHCPIPIAALRLVCTVA